MPLLPTSTPCSALVAAHPMVLLRPQPAAGPPSPAGHPHQAPVCPRTDAPDQASHSTPTATPDFPPQWLHGTLPATSPPASDHVTSPPAAQVSAQGCARRLVAARPSVPPAQALPTRPLVIPALSQPTHPTPPPCPGPSTSVPTPPAYPRCAVLLRIRSQALPNKFAYFFWVEDTFPFGRESGPPPCRHF